MAYSPTEFDPTVGRPPLRSALRDDLQVLHDAGFQGVITYAATSALDRIPQLAKEAGFTQVIMGVWDPLNREEIAAAIEAAPLVDGYLVGNEGLSDKRYTFDELRNAIEEIRRATQKPVTTAERIDAYYGLDDLVTLGDWLAAIVHPYWFDFKEPSQAAEWTAEQFADLRDEVGPDRVILFKEVGLPTEGDPVVSEEGQAQYYQTLQESDVVFAYFEAFDQFWKASTPESDVGPHWGLFQSDRTPKPVVGYVCGRTPPTPAPTPTVEAPPMLPFTSTLPSGPSSTTALTLTVTPAPLLPTPSSAISSTGITLYDGSLGQEYVLNIANASNQYDWLHDDNGTLRADFLANQAWAAVYITVGDQQPEGKRTQAIDLSGCHTLTVDLRAGQDNVEVMVGIKDTTDKDNGQETRIPVRLTTTWQTLPIPLLQFKSADLQQVYLPFQLVYLQSSETTVFIDNIYILCE
ncbi:MAG: hypothetical protein DYG89_34475 [Caldilinea sp. CFX5]|nr:hypothetical protein [Caldilinea sp. CFX5]